MELRPIRAGFVGFGEVNSPRDLIEQKCQAAQRALSERGLDVIAAEPVYDDPAGQGEAQASATLASQRFDLLVVCIAGWIPSQTVINVIREFIHIPMVLWGLTGYTEGGRLVTTADQAGTTALRDPMEALGFRFKYVYDTPDGGGRAADQVVQFGRVARAISLLQHARIGMMGYRDMHLYATLVDGVSLRRVLGVEIEVFDTLEVVQRMEALNAAEVAAAIAQARGQWVFDRPATDLGLEPGVRMYLALAQKVQERRYAAISVVDGYGVKKLLHFPPAMVMQLLMDQAGVAAIPENDGLGAVTQLIVRYLTGQAGAYFEFYEFFTDRLLVGVPDFIPAAITDGPTRMRPWPEFAGLTAGLLNVSTPQTGQVTLCRLASRGDRYRLHLAIGQAVTARPWEEAGWAPPAPQLPSLEISLAGAVDDFAQQVLGQHYILAYGDHRAPLRDFCRLLGIAVVETN